MTDVLSVILVYLIKQPTMRRLIFSTFKKLVKISQPVKLVEKCVHVKKYQKVLKIHFI